MESRKTKDYFVYVMFRLCFLLVKRTNTPVTIKYFYETKSGINSPYIQVARTITPRDSELCIFKSKVQARN